jgi:hypothetical protein
MRFGAVAAVWLLQGLCLIWFEVALILVTWLSAMRCAVKAAALAAYSSLQDDGVQLSLGQWHANPISSVANPSSSLTSDED